MASDLANLGIPDAVRQQLGAVDTGPPSIHCFEGHLESLQVYRSCQWHLIAVPHRQSIRWQHLGIDAVEIEATARLMGVPKRERAGVFRNVRLMAAAAAPILNEDR